MSDAARAGPRVCWLITPAMAESLASTFPTRWSAWRASLRNHTRMSIFETASAEQLPFADNEFTHAFSMESLYYYADISKALKEIHRVLKPGGLFVAVVDMYWESEATHQWIEMLNVPVQLLSIQDYRSLFEGAGFDNVRDERILDPRPVPDDYTSGSFKSRDRLCEVSRHRVVDDQRKGREMNVGSERIVTIFGGSKCGEDSPEYAEAHRAGELLAEAGFTVFTGCIPRNQKLIKSRN